VTPDETETAAQKFGLEARGIAGRPIFALNPGAEYGPAKRWPLDRFAAAAREIQKQTDCVWLILGGKSDATTATEIHSALLATPKPGDGGRTPHSLPCQSQAAAGAFNLAGQTTLRELMAVLKFSRLLLTNDTGPMHVAAALGTPVVVPFGSTSPELTGPGLPGDARHRLIKADAPCSPCFLRSCPIDFRCMAGITVEQVVEAVREAVR
jgi:heptosyltransferase-2